MHRNLLSVLGLGMFGVAACSGGTSPGEGELGSLRAAIEVSRLHDVSAVRFDVVAAGQSCQTAALASKVVALESEALEQPLAGSGAHAFGDGFFVLPAGSYRVCATPLAGEVASADCAATEADVSITAGSTQEVVLTSQCSNPSNGGGDVVVALNDAPLITQLTLDPSKFISICESVTVTAVATDPNSDVLSYAWSITSGPEGGRLRATGETAVFSGAAGDYTLLLEVDDGHGGKAKLEFPIHVSTAECALPAAVDAIITERCSPCHTERASGGLSMPSAAQAYANLVGVLSHAAACSTQTLVVPGDPASSYLIAKLRGTTGICGAQMPRNAPPLPETEIQTIESWVQSLPH